MHGFTKSSTNIDGSMVAAAVNMGGAIGNRTKNHGRIVSAAANIMDAAISGSMAAAGAAARSFQISVQENYGKD